MKTIYKQPVNNYLYVFDFLYDTSIVDFCRSLKASYGWQDFGFDFENKKWRFNNIGIVDEIMDKYPDTSIMQNMQEDWEAIKKPENLFETIPEMSNKKGFKLRPYQKEAVDKVMKSLKLGLPGNDLIVLPTAAGKSICIAEIVSILKKPILIIQPTREILTQNKEKLLRYVDKSKIGVYSASMNEKTIKLFTLATIASIYKKPELFAHFKMIIIDEAHLLSPANLTGMFSSFIKKVNVIRLELLNEPAIKVIGLTATPYRLASGYTSLGGGYFESFATIKLINRIKGKADRTFWTRILLNVNVEDLVKQGYLCKLEYIDASIIDHIDIPLNKSGTDFDLEAFEEKISAKEEKILKTIEYTKSISKSVLVFCSSVSQAEKLSSLVENSAVVSSKTPSDERMQIVEDFKNNKIKIVFNMGVYTCLSDDTEILTSNNGWVGIDNVNKNNKIAQYDKGKITFTCPIAIHKKKLQDNEMVGMDGKCVSMLVTKDHDLLIAKIKSGSIRPTDKDFKKIKAEEVINKRWLIPVSGLATPLKMIAKQKPQPNKIKFLVSNSYNFRKKGLSHKEAKNLSSKMYEKKCCKIYKNPEELTLEECKLIGFWIGDGTKYNSLNNGTIYSISQSLGNPKMIFWLENLLKNNNIHFSFKDYPPQKKVLICGNYCNSSGCRRYLLSKGTGGHNQEKNGLYKIIPFLEKKGTELFWGLDRNQYISLIEGLWKADGEHGDNKNFVGRKITGEYKELFDLFQAIGVCRGFRVTIKLIKKRIFNKKQLYSLSLSDKTIHQLSNNRLKKMPYDKERMIWCVTMPKGTIVTRRNGTVTIMGNCGFDFPALDCIVILRPTRSIGLHTQIIGRGLRIAEGKKSCKIIDMTSNVKNLGRVETIKLVQRNGMWELESETGSWHNKELYRFIFKKKKKDEKEK